MARCVHVHVFIAYHLTKFHCSTLSSSEIAKCNARFFNLQCYHIYPGVFIESTKFRLDWLLSE